MGCALRQPTVDVDVIRQVAADFDLSNLRSEPGMTNLEPLARAASEAQALLARTNPAPGLAPSHIPNLAPNLTPDAAAKLAAHSAPLRARRGEPLNPEDALAYIQEFIRRLKKDPYFAN